MELDIIGLSDSRAVYVQAELILRIAVACALGLMIGYERKNRNKSAGIRTHTIVAMGSALIMIVSKYGFADMPDYDASRVAAQIVSGVGFLGTGVIFVRNNLVNGLTTAAGIWATAGIGMAIGAGMYVISVSAALMMILTQEIMHRISFFAQAASGGSIRLTLVQKSGVIKYMENFLGSQKINIAAVKIHKNKKDEIKVEFEVIYPPGFDKARLFSSLAEDENVTAILE